MEPLIHITLKCAVILGGIWVVERLITSLLKRPSLLPFLQTSMRTLLITANRVTIYALGLLMVLDTFGISITPLLASLGVSSLAVALALQDTLGNFFSGIYLLIDEPIRVGDTVRIDPGVEGKVVRIGWRSTHIRLGSQDLIILPNSKVSGSIITNFSLPTQETVLSLPFGVHPSSNLTLVLQLSGEVIANGFQREGQTRVQGFGEKQVLLQTTIALKTLDEGPSVRHEFYRALHERFVKENIQLSTESDPSR